MAEKKKPGPKPRYQQSKPDKNGAPLLASRVEPEAFEWAKSRPEGTRPFLERIILEDKRKATSSASAGLKDVPGQTLIPEVLASTGIVSETESGQVDPPKKTRSPKPSS